MSPSNPHIGIPFPRGPRAQGLGIVASLTYPRHHQGFAMHCQKSSTEAYIVAKVCKAVGGFERATIPGKEQFQVFG